ncbi:hypothetical protein HAX54_010855 [Datura stramonium]|uniref:Uncharacterized protein n=1 Tax=Datura stramonium TaxID=4076 RepID=A0ABS8TIC6_DATST|nr:hypothetical protein [Datura stramonium]
MDSMISILVYYDEPSTVVTVLLQEYSPCYSGIPRTAAVPQVTVVTFLLRRTRYSARNIATPDSVVTIVVHYGGPLAMVMVSLQWYFPRCIHPPETSSSYSLHIDHSLISCFKSTHPTPYHQQPRINRVFQAYFSLIMMDESLHRMARRLFSNKATMQAARCNRLSSA